MIEFNGYKELTVQSYFYIYMQYKFHLNNNIDKATKSPTYKLPSKMVVCARSGHILTYAKDLHPCVRWKSHNLHDCETSSNLDYYCHQTW